MQIQTPIQDELLYFLRVAWINSPEDLEQAELAFQNRPITLQNEMRVYTMLELKINQILTSFSTLEDDKKQLESFRGKSDSITDFIIYQLLEQVNRVVFRY